MCLHGNGSKRQWGRLHYLGPTWQRTGARFRRPFPKSSQKWLRILGKKLTAYIAGVKDTRVVERWMQGGIEPYRAADPRIRLAYQIAKTLREHDSARVVQAWFTGLNPELQDRTPIRLLREGNVEEVGPELLNAMRAFLAGG